MMKNCSVDNKITTLASSSLAITDTIKSEIYYVFNDSPLSVDNILQNARETFLSLSRLLHPLPICMLLVYRMVLKLDVCKL